MLLRPAIYVLGDAELPLSLEERNALFPVVRELTRLASARGWDVVDCTAKGCMELLRCVAAPASIQEYIVRQARKARRMLTRYRCRRGSESKVAHVWAHSCAHFASARLLQSAALPSMLEKLPQLENIICKCGTPHCDKFEMTKDDFHALRTASMTFEDFARKYTRECQARCFDVTSDVSLCIPVEDCEAQDHPKRVERVNAFNKRGKRDVFGEFVAEFNANASKRARHELHEQPWITEPARF
jgi:hypothetical protein